MRKLAHIEKVTEVIKHPNADKLDICTVLGWNIITKKDEIKENDLVIFVEIDSILPDIPIFEFLRKYKFRIKTQKLRGIVSQGLVLPIHTLLEFTSKTKWDEGDDVTDIIGIKKYDPQAAKEDKYRPIKSKKRNFLNEYMMSFQWYRSLRYKLGFSRMRNFPTFISKTDEERIQNMPQVFRQWALDLFYYTEKLDGTSATYALYKDDDLLFSFLRKPDFYVCSRNICLYKENKTEWWNIARRFDIKNKLKRVGKNIAIQGEIVGDRVQGNKYEYKQGELDFFVFNIFDIDNHKRYDYYDKNLFCDKYGFKTVPILGDLYLDQFDLHSILKFAEGKSILNNKVEREGLVFRSMLDDHKSFKAISNKFLLKYGE